MTSLVMHVFLLGLQHQTQTHPSYKAVTYKAVCYPVMVMTLLYWYEHLVWQVIIGSCKYSVWEDYHIFFSSPF